MLLMGQGRGVSILEVLRILALTFDLPPIKAKSFDCEAPYCYTIFYTVYVCI